MFYQTQIKSIGAGSIKNEQGKTLYFAGYLPCKVGDYVWTDGNFVFGHMPIRGTPLILHKTTGGIPVLGDLDSLRGYFNKSGDFKSYNIAVDNWIVNDDEKFYHGSEDLLDAEVADDGDLLTAELSSPEVFSAAFKGQLQILEVLNDSNVIIKKGGEVIQELSLIDFIQDVKLNFSWGGKFGIIYISVGGFKFLPDGNWDCILNVAISLGVEDINTSDVPGLPPTGDDSVFEYRVIGSFEDFSRDNRDEFLEKSSLDFEEFGGHPLLKHALLAVWEKMLYYGTLDGTVGYHGEKLLISFLFNDESIVFNDSDNTTPSGTDDSSNTIPTYIGTGEYILHLKSTGDSEYSTDFFFGNDSQAQNSGRTYVTYIKSHIKKDSFDKYYPSKLPATSVSVYGEGQPPLAIVVVNDDGDIVYGPDIGVYFFEPERRNNFLRGVWSYSCYPVDYVNADNKRIKGTEFIFYRKFPDEGQTVYGAVGNADPNGYSWDFMITDFSPFKEEDRHYNVFSLVPSDDFYFVVHEYCQEEINAGFGGGGGSSGAPAPDSEFKFTVQDGFYATIKNGLSRQLFAPDDSVVASNFVHDTFNFSAAELNNGNFVFGKYGGYLCKKQDNTYQILDEHLKNFRLRELKNISKAKK